jgi:hypothetical protein
VRPEETPADPPADTRVTHVTNTDDEEVTRALDDLLSALILPPEKDAPRKRAHQLSGQLASIKMPTLFSLFEMERMTGKLIVVRDRDEGRIFLRDGQIVDVEPLARKQTLRARIMQLLAWEDGSFEFSVEAVARPNKLGVGMTALLLDLARESDEKSRGSGRD